MPQRCSRALTKKVKVGARVVGQFDGDPPDGRLRRRTLDGRPGELTWRRYERFARGGAKLIWFEATAVREDGRANTRQL